MSATSAPSSGTALPNGRMSPTSSSSNTTSPTGDRPQIRRPINKSMTLASGSPVTDASFM